jgi:hypothetical protein
MEALLNGLLEDKPCHLREWLALAAPVRHVLKPNTPISKSRQRAIAAPRRTSCSLFGKLAKLSQLIKSRLADGSLRLHGWFFKIATSVFAFDPETKQFLRWSLRSNQL